MIIHTFTQKTVTGQKGTESKFRAFTEEKLDETGDGPEQSPLKSLRHLAQVTAI
jgi:hypothetical protein